MAEDQQSSQISDTVPALRRAVRILDLVSGSPRNLTAAELTRVLDLPKSTAHGLLAVMTELDLLARSADGTLRIGAHSLRWANGFLSQLDIVSAFNDHLAQRHDLDPYTVTLTVREGGEVVYIGCRNSAQPLGHTFRIGMRLPAPFTATGKILPDLTAVFVVATGIAGAVMGETMLARLHLRSSLARGALFGVAAHAAGTAKAHEIGPTEGAVAGLVMVLVGLMNVLAAPVLAGLLR